MGPTVTLDFKGNNTDLMQSVDEAGDGVEEMANRVEKATKDIRSHAKAFDTMGEKTDAAEQKFTGFADVLDGGKSALEAWGDESLSTTEKLVAFGQAGADMAGGLTDFLIPAISTMTTLMRGGLASAMNFIAAHPLIIALAALAAIFVLLWTNSETFRKIVIGVFETVGNFIKGVFGPVIDWLVGAWNNVISFFADFPNRIGRIFGSLGSIITGAFKGAVNMLVDSMNWFLDHTLNWLVDRANDVIAYIPGVPYIPKIPHIPRMHTGISTVPGGPGTEMIARLQAGEKVVTESESNKGGELVVVGDARSFLYQMMNYGVRTGKIRRT